MVVTSIDKARRILTTMKNGMVISFGEVKMNVKWLNQEEILSTMQGVQGKGMDKVALRTALENLTNLEFLEKRIPERKTQSRAEYSITEKGENKLKELDTIDLSLT